MHGVHGRSDLHGECSDAHASWCSPPRGHMGPQVLPYQKCGGVIRPNRPNYHTQISSFAWQFTVQIKSMPKLTVLECQWRPSEVPQIPSRAGA
jgi:hypothetical protein